MVALSMWVGMMACVAFLVAPAAFGVLGREAAGRVMGAVFPRYYWFGLALGLAAAVGVLARGRPASWAAGGVLAVLALMLALTAYAALVLLPEIRTLAPGAGGIRPERLVGLHRLAVLANAVVLLAGMAAIGLETLAPRASERRGLRRPPEAGGPPEISRRRWRPR
jgi:hypothetical protein